MGAQFTVPLQQVVAGQLISKDLWNNEWNNLSTNLIPAGLDSYSNTDPQMQLQTNPYPGSVTSHATNLGGELERIRYIIAQITGNPNWYQSPASSISTLNNVSVPVGGVIDYPSATAPNANYHLADGTAINRVLFPALFTLIGTTFGIGDGTLTFNLPDYRDRMSIGAGNLYAVAATGGEATHILTTPEIPAHLHTASSVVTDPGHAHSVTGVSVGINAGGGGNGPFLDTASGSYPTTNTTTGVTVATTTANTGGGGAHNNLPPYLGMYKMIRVL